MRRVLAALALALSGAAAAVEVGAPAPDLAIQGVVALALLYALAGLARGAGEPQNAWVKGFERRGYEASNWSWSDSTRDEK